MTASARSSPRFANDASNTVGPILWTTTTFWLASPASPYARSRSPPAGYVANHWYGTLAHMVLNIEKRHVIGHNLGIADEHYVALTQTDQPGETVNLIAEDIGRFADSCLVVIAGLEDALLPNAGTLPDAPNPIDPHD